MRSIRRAALAGATAATLLIGATSVAVANDDPADTPNGGTTNSKTKDKDSEKEKDDNSSKFTAGSSADNDDKDSDSKDKKGEKSKESSSKSLTSSEGAAKAEKLDLDTCKNLYEAKQYLAKVSRGDFNDERNEIWTLEHIKEDHPEAWALIEDAPGGATLSSEGKIACGATEVKVPNKMDQLSYVAGAELQANRSVDGRSVWGSERSEIESLPNWAKLFKGATVAGVIGSVLGLVIFPFYNFLLANGYIR